MDMQRVELVSHSPEETRMLGVWLGKHLRPGSLLLLSGNLGAGKTHLAQGVARGLGIEDYVSSPTFTLINEHHSGRIPLYHIDLYRIGSPAEAMGLGLDDYMFGNGICLIEWPEQAAQLMPSEALTVALDHTANPEWRRIELHAGSSHYNDLLHHLQDRQPEMRLAREAESSGIPGVTRQ